MSKYTLKYIFKTWRNKNTVKKDPHRFDKTNMGVNIYATGMPYNEYQKRFARVHFVWKYKFFMPGIRLGARILGKHLIREVPKADHNVNLELFHEAVEEAIDTWARCYMAKAYNEHRETASGFKKFMTKSRDEEWIQQFKNGSSANTLRLMRDTTVTVCLNDTAYREYFNIFAHTFAKKMAAHHAANPDKRTGHLFYSASDLYDVDYFMLFKKIEIEKSMALKNVNINEYSKAREEMERSCQSGARNA
jgi:hypothetical protein